MRPRTAASYSDVSLSTKTRAKEFLLPTVPHASSPVTRVSLAFRARLYTKNEVPKEEAGV